MAADTPLALSTWLVLAWVLGVRHGLDPDHLAAIDGLTRSNARDRPQLARLSGLLFSLGHGAIVVAVACAASASAQSWAVPTWLEAFGAWTSIALLLTLAGANIRAVFATPATESAVPIGWRARLFRRWLRAGRASTVLGVGALFALSFDTLSQATLFSVASVRLGGTATAVCLAAVFVVGMLCTDGANGWWIARLIARADRTARVASRTLALTISGVALLTAGLGVAVRTSAAAAVWAERHQSWFGVALIGTVLAGFLVAMRLAGAPSGRRTGGPPDSRRR